MAKRKVHLIQNPVLRWLFIAFIMLMVAVMGSVWVAAATGQPTGIPVRVVNEADVQPIPHVMWIFEENRSYANIIGSPSAPYINSLATIGEVFSNEHNITHPSAPNYIGSTSGEPLSSLPATDCTACKQSVPSIFNQGPWKAYEESMTTNCRMGQDSGGLYVPRHNPATYFTSILAPKTWGGDNTCSKYDVPLTKLQADLDAGTLPAYTFVTPNLNDDMHNGSITAGDTWLSTFLPTVLQSSVYQSGGLTIYLMWDEGTGKPDIKGMDCINSPSPSCNPALLALNANIVPGSTDATFLTHYSVLAATETALGYPLLGQAATAPTLSLALTPQP